MEMNCFIECNYRSINAVVLSQRPSRPNLHAVLPVWWTEVGRQDTSRFGSGRQNAGGRFSQTTGLFETVLKYFGNLFANRLEFVSARLCT